MTVRSWMMIKGELFTSRGATTTFLMAVWLTLFTLSGCVSKRPAETIRASGEHRFKIGDYPGARDEYAEIVGRYPGDWNAQYMLGKSLLQTGDYSAARRALQTANDIRPNNEEIESALAEAMFRQGDETRLFAFLRERAAATQSPSAHLKLAHYAAEMGDPDSAQAAVETAIQIDGGQSTEPYLEAARLAERLGHMDEAVRRLKQGYGVNPADRRIHERLLAMGEEPSQVSPVPPGR